MGNGRWSEEDSGKSSAESSAESLGQTLGKDSGKSLLWFRTLGGLVVLLVAGSVLLGLGSGRHAQESVTQKSVAQHLASPGAELSRLSLKSKPESRAILGQLPLIFEPNQGQADPAVKFLAHGSGYSLFLDANGAVLAMQTAPSSSSSAKPTEQFVRMKLVGSNPAAALAGADALPGKSNYMIGNDPQKWHSGIPQFGGVHYAAVYPGIDLVFYGNQGHLEYDFRVAPGANASQAELEFDGASNLKLKLSGGDLILTSKDDGGLRLRAPKVYQRDGDRHVPVAGRFVLRAANRVGFEIGNYDRSRELIIDPLLDFSTYFGGSGTETSPSVAVNGNGEIYIVGSTTSPPASFPLGTTTPAQIGTAPNIFVAEINPSQPPSVVYATFIGGSGGSGADTSVGIGVDAGGNAYLVGNTSSTDFPTFGIPYQTAPETKTNCAGLPTCTSVFVSVLNPAGSALIYSSYLSGNGDDQASGMTIDTKGDVFLTGTTTSQDVPSLTDAFPATYFPVPYQQTPKTSLQFFVTEVNTKNPNSVGGIAYSTYFGGGTPAPVAANCGTPPCNVGGGIAVDATGNVYFSGTTNFFNSGLGQFGDSSLSTDFPIVNAYQPCLDTVPPTTLTNPYQCTAPTTGGAPYPTDAFVAKINPLGAVGTQLLFSTYFGGAGNETGPAIAIDSGAAHIYLTGETNTGQTSATAISFNLPTGITPFQLCLDTPPVTPPNVPPCPTITATPAPFDAYVAQMTNPTQNASGTPVDVALTYFTYLGGAGNDSASAIAVLDSQSTTLNDVVLTGTTASSNFPTTIGAFQTTLNGAQNAFFSQINTTTTVNQNNVGSFSTYFGGNGVDRGTGIAVDPNLNSYFVGDTTSTNFEVKNPLPPGTLNGTRNAFVVELGTAASLSVACLGQCVSPNTATVSAGNPVTVTFTVANEGPDPATNIQVSGNVPISEGVTFDSATVGSGTCSAPSSNAVVCQIPTLQSGALATVTFVVTPNGLCNSCSVTAMVSSANDTNTSNTATASFTADDYTVAISPPSQTVAAGLPARYAVNLSPTGSFPAYVTLSCSALPTGAGCSFTSNTVSFSGGNGSASVGLNLTTTAQPETTVSSTGWRHPIYAFWLMVPGMALLGLGSGGKAGGKKMKRLWGLLALSVLFAAVLLQPSCSTGKTQPTVSGTPSGTYALTITATSGTFTQSAPFSLTVVP
ncbi:MAG: SBBP repeat-containing protein [Candidatus Sulfotelmatobacter sp.]